MTPVPGPVIKHRQIKVCIENIRQIPVFSGNEKLPLQQQKHYNLKLACHFQSQFCGLHLPNQLVSNSAMIKRFLTCAVVSLAVSIQITANSQEAFLKKGTTALNPEDGQTLFLYIPGYTLLYDLGEVKDIGSQAFGTREKYQLATTQDGVQVLVRKPDIRTDVEKINNQYDFLVNRRMPLCELEDICRNIWNDFSSASDEGVKWSALWPRTAGIFLEQEDKGIREVSVSIGGAWEEGYIPTKKDRLRLEDAGFISLLNRKYPLFQFTEKNIDELSSPCGSEQSTRNERTLLREIETYAKASLNTKIGVDESILGAIPRQFVSSVLSFLGLEANVSVDAFISGNWKEESTQEKGTNIVYGDRNQQWLVKTIDIKRRSDGEDDVYHPFGSAMIRKVLECEAGQPTEMTFASFLLTLVPESTETVPTPAIINMNTEIISQLELLNRSLDKGLVSINTQTSHNKLVDFFLRKNIPKSIANLFIKEINVAEARR